MEKVLLNGRAAHPGKIRGKVRIIQDKPGDDAMLKALSEVCSGEILVTQMTRPLFVAVMHKVAGIITDHGGVLCHAAMVAREFKIPCIVGTKDGTKILKTGQEVIVDAENGIIYQA